MSREDYKSSALYEVWQFITRRAQLEDSWYAERGIPHEPCLHPDFKDYEKFSAIVTSVMGYRPGRDNDKMLNRKNHSKPFSPENCYLCDRFQTIRDCDSFFRQSMGRAPVTRSRRPPREIAGHHRRSNTRLYEIWKGARRRCTSPSCKDYPDYGGRGITMCNAWREDFDAFWDWAWDHGYNPELSLERVDVDKGYSPENCRWASDLEQKLNRQDTGKIYRAIRLRAKSMRALLELIPDGSVVTLVARRDALPGRIAVEDDYEPVPLDQRVDKVRKK